GSDGRKFWSYHGALHAFSLGGVFLNEDRIDKRGSRPMHDIPRLAGAAAPDIFHDNQRLDAENERQRLGEAIEIGFADSTPERSDCRAQEFDPMATCKGGLVAERTRLTRGPLVEREFECCPECRFESVNSRHGTFDQVAGALAGVG